jgi:hypothetical protein
MNKDTTRIYTGEVQECDRTIESDTEMYLILPRGYVRVDDIFRMCDSGRKYRIIIEPLGEETLEEALDELEDIEPSYSDRHLFCRSVSH